MKIGYLGTGSWGFCLASLLASKGYEVVSWTTNSDLAKQLNEGKIHPLFPKHHITGALSFTTDLAFTLQGADLLVESVTSAGIRPVFRQIRELEIPSCPIILTSKGIEQNTGLILADVITGILGEEVRNRIGLLSGPGFAQEVIQGLPTSVVGSGFSAASAQTVCEIFTTKTFRVYPNLDIRGVSYGGALKNIIAIACGIAHGLHLGNSAMAALITRGLHEMRKLAVALGCKSDTLNGLSGMGDLVLTCSSPMSRNFRYGSLLASGMTPEEAERKIQMVVEGKYTCLSALQLSKTHQISMPIAETVEKIIQVEMTPIEAVYALMQRAIKEEHL